MTLAYPGISAQRRSGAYGEDVLTWFLPAAQDLLFD